MANNSKLLAFFMDRGRDLHELAVLSLKDGAVYKVPDNGFGSEYAWVPFGQRLIYTRHYNQGSELRVFDVFSGKSKTLQSYSHALGAVNIDPRDMRIRLVHEKGLHNLQLRFPGLKLARWQTEAQAPGGSFLVSRNRVFTVNENGTSLHPVFSSEFTIRSFSLSPDGLRLAWATDDGKLYQAILGQKSQWIGFGRDPSWHPRLLLLAFSGARQLGQQSIDQDICILDERGMKHWLTFTPQSAERWPVWDELQKRLIFTIEKTTDLYAIGYEHAAFVASASTYPIFSDSSEF